MYRGRILTGKCGVAAALADSTQWADILGQLIELYDLLRANAVVAEDLTPRITTLDLLALDIIVVGSNAEDDIILLGLCSVL